MSTPDPIFAAIEAHRTAHATHLAAIDEAERVEQSGQFTDITEKPCVEDNEAFAAVLRMAATTLEGLAAKLAYLRSIADSNEAWMIDEHDEGSLLLIDSIAASLRNTGVLL